MRFLDFRDGPGRETCVRLGFDIGECTTWRDYSVAAIRFNNRRHGALCESAQAFYEQASTGERAVLLAALAAADFAALADKLADGRTWTILDYTDRRHRAAVAACIVRQD